MQTGSLNKDMHEDFQYLVSEYGDFTDVKTVAADDLKSLREVFPAEFIDFLQEAGVGVWQRGRFQFCNPIEMTELCRLIFAGDADFKPERTFIYGYGAIGRLFVWNADWNETMEIDLPRLEATSLLNKKAKERGMGAIVSSILYLDQGFYDLLDPESAKPVLAKTLKKHGFLRVGEVLGYFPALAMGGSGTPETLKKVSALEHFTFLAQLGPIKLNRVQEGGGKFLRNLGS